VRIVLAGLLCAALCGCSGVAFVNATTSERDVVLVRNVPYGPVPGAVSQVADPARAIDVYRPALLPGPLPVVVFLHGGDWRSGSRGQYLFLAERLARQGVIVAVAGYREVPHAPYPAFLQDAAQAVALVRRSAASWGGDPNRVFVMGHSAGAYIAAMLALDPEWLQQAGLDRDAVAGTIAISGPYDFLPITRPDVQAVFAPAAPDLSTTQPITYADGSNRPLLLITGLADETVSPSNTRNLAARIEAAGGPVQVDAYPGVGHVGTISAYAGDFGSDAPTMADVLRFIDDPANVAPG
jgi:acetyl esterase/lipase